MDPIIRAILEERDAEALRMLKKNPLELSFVNSIPGCTRPDALARFERLDSTIIHYNERIPESRLWASWSKKQKVIASALEILDAFVPVEYQIMDHYWLIKKFWGALLKFANDDVTYHSMRNFAPS